MRKEIREVAKNFRSFERHGVAARDMFRDFVDASFNALFKNIELEPGQGELREAAYMEIANRYSGFHRNAAVIRELFPSALAACATVNAECEDFLGQLAQELEVLNARQGQFFTPASLAGLIARMQIDATTVARVIGSGRRFTISEPACGAGIMLLEAAKHLGELQVDLGSQVTMYAIDAAPLAFRMCAIQLTLANIPAVVYLGNGLSHDIEAECSDKVVTRVLAQRVIDAAMRPAAE